MAPPDHPPMRIHALAIHPIKSLAPVSLPASTLGALGLQHDRTFLLQDATTGGVLHIGKVSQLCQFTVALGGAAAAAAVVVQHPSAADALTVPLEPDTDGLARVAVDMHSSPTTAFGMPREPFGRWFSEALGADVRLVYLGRARRQVLGNVAPAPRSWLGSWLGGGREIGFTDCAPLLLATTASLAAAAARVPAGAADARRFRPNIVLDNPGAEAFDEDYWAELELPDGGALALTANCVRCRSLDVDFASGGWLPGPATVLRRLMPDRRVDRGMPWSPVFGRYAFLLEPAADVAVEVGQEVRIVRRNAERTRLRWPGLTKDD